MAEGARLESVFRGNSNVGSNPTLSAISPSMKIPPKLPLSDDLKHGAAGSVAEVKAAGV